jgi:chromosomal replication initiation ATPase DnaA
MFQKINKLVWKNVTKEQLHESELKLIDILGSTAIHFEVSMDDMLGKCRTQEFVNARHSAMYLIDQYINKPKHERFRILPIERIGYLFDADHASVLHALKSIEWFYHKERHIKEKIDSIKQDIGIEVDK